MDWGSIAKLLFSWPTAVIIFFLLFRKPIHSYLLSIRKKDMSIKVPGMELSLSEPLKELSKEETGDDKDQFEKVYSQIMESDSSVDPESIREEIETALSRRTIADRQLFLKTISFQLVAWLYNHRDGATFGIEDLMTRTWLAVAQYREKAWGYCLHAPYEKHAIAAEFRRNIFLLESRKIVILTDDQNVTVNQDHQVQLDLENAMKTVIEVEHERNVMSLALEKYLPKNRKSTYKPTSLEGETPKLPTSKLRHKRKSGSSSNG